MQAAHELDVEMRAVPTLVAETGTNKYALSLSGAFRQFSGLGLDGGTTERAIFLFQNSGITATQGDAGLLYAVDAKLAYDAEL